MKKKANKTSAAIGATFPVAVISGGLGDIGRAIADELFNAGFCVSLGDVLSQKEAEEVFPQLADTERWHYHTVDVRSPEAVEGWLKAANDKWGAPKVAVLNAAVFTQASILAMTAESFANDLEVNLCGAFHLAQAASKLMALAGNGGHIIAIGSWAADTPHPNVPAYGVSKAGLRMMMQILAIELAPLGIHVNEVAPGYVNAGLSAKIFRDDPKTMDRCKKRVPIQRLVQPKEIAQEVIHLVSDSNRNKTGCVIKIDGGLTLGPLAKGV